VVSLVSGGCARSGAGGPAETRGGRPWGPTALPWLGAGIIGMGFGARGSRKSL